MSRCRVIREFPFAYGGIHVRIHHVGDFIEASDEAHKLSLEEKWAVPDEQKQPQEQPRGGSPDSGLSSPGSGPEKPSLSRRRVRRSKRES